MSKKYQKVQIKTLFIKNICIKIILDFFFPLQTTENLNSNFELFYLQLAWY